MIHGKKKDLYGIIRGLSKERLLELKFL